MTKTTWVPYSAAFCTVLAGVALSGCSDDSTNHDGTAGAAGEGSPGAAGARDGKDGSDGSDGKDGVDGKNGLDGATGENGENGNDGLDGKNGVDGKDGSNGVDGKPGKDAPVSGPAVVFVSVPKAVSAQTSASFAFGCTAGNCTYQCSLDGAAYTTCKSPLTLGGLSLAEHTLAVKANVGADAAGPVTSATWKVKQPNILYIMADDLGYSDVHALGGEIDTPNLDELISNGRILTNHHAGTVSAITRSMLISGTDHHLVGEGTMGAPNDVERKGKPGYEGFLNDSSLSLAELLKDAGYHTYMAGKWHLGNSVATPEIPVPTNGKTPDLWGFERSYALLGGAAGNHFFHESPTSKAYTEDGKYVQPGQPGQAGTNGTPNYSTDFYTQQLIKYIDSNKDDGKPFFAYAAYTSPHWPLQVPEPWLSQYRGRYDQGYEPIRAQRVARLRSLGLIPYSWTPHAPNPETLTRPPGSVDNGKAACSTTVTTNCAKYISAEHSLADGYTEYGQGYVNKLWDSLSADEKKAQSRYMEIYAGMVSNLDWNIGLLIQHLKDIGAYDDTFIMFQSDNGAEGWPISTDPKTVDEANAAPAAFAKLGTDNNSPNAQNLKYGLRWGEVSATPFAQTKGSFGEGGYSVPAFVHTPGQVGSATPYRSFTHVTDNTATFLALAGVTLPTTPAPAEIDAVTGVDKNKGKVVYKARNVFPVTGKSLLAALDGSTSAVWTTPFGEESYGRALIFSADGKWKARWTEPAQGGPADGHWELFDILVDRGETNDVSAQNPSVLSALFGNWQTYMTSVGGIEPLRPAGYY